MDICRVATFFLRLHSLCDGPARTRVHPDRSSGRKSKQARGGAGCPCSAGISIRVPLLSASLHHPIRDHQAITHQSPVHHLYRGLGRLTFSGFLSHPNDRFHFHCREKPDHALSAAFGCRMSKSLRAYIQVKATEVCLVDLSPTVLPPSRLSPASAASPWLGILLCVIMSSWPLCCNGSADWS